MERVFCQVSVNYLLFFFVNSSESLKIVTLVQISLAGRKVDFPLAERTQYPSLADLKPSLTLTSVGSGGKTNKEIN